ncbi:MAG: YgiQ family radical SAM protein [Desulforegulaceae bacterium]|nr:YgiQ family radical SAM protein [Desulforegulaceae bacterium]
MNKPDFIPSTPQEIKQKGWDKLDVIIVSGDANIDSSFIGSAIIARVLLSKGYKTAIISQPDISSDKDIKRLGEPKLFWGVTAGAMDSMVSNYTASGKKRNKDDLTPGGINNRRPDLATIKYTNLIQRYFKNSAPVVLGGIEASLRRISHFDFISKKIRRSILFDSKADYLLFGMGEKSIIELAHCLKNKISPINIRGLAYISKEIPNNYELLPSYEEVLNDKDKFHEMFLKFYENKEPLNSNGLVQLHNDRYLVLNPPSPNLTQKELDEVYELPYTRKVHPFDLKKGEVRAVETINHSVTTHRGCYGECSFCAIAVHQGTTIVSRSEESILKEVEKITQMETFKGYITDLGGPTANMYGFECKKKISSGPCTNKKCLFPDVCRNLKPNHKKQIELIEKAEKIKNVKKVFISSGIRYDLILQDREYGEKYLKKLIENNISGQLKIAPEHCDDKILSLMGKPSSTSLKEFKSLFDRLAKNKKLFLTYYFIAAHPGCTKKEMLNLKKFCINILKHNPKQVQIFTPTPCTISTMMYYTEKDVSGNKLFTAKTNNEKEAQKNIIITESSKVPKKQTFK